jgi:tubulin-folding cofactor B
VTDTDASSLAAQGWLEDTSKVDKYVISEEDYSARDNTYRKFKEGKLKEDPTWTLEKEMAARAGEGGGEGALVGELRRGMMKAVPGATG